MYYRSAQTIRKGPRMMGMGFNNNPHCYDGYGGYGIPGSPIIRRTSSGQHSHMHTHPHKGHRGVLPSSYGAYGASWVPKQKRLDNCPEMADYYDQWLDEMEEKKRKCSWPYLGKCAKKYRQRQASLERKGKAAWDMCKGQAKVDQAVANQPIDWSADMIPPGGTQYPMTTTTPGGGQTTTTPTDPYHEEEEDDGFGGTMLIMGLVGGSALLLLLLLKK